MNIKYYVFGFLSFIILSSCENAFQPDTSVSVVSLKKGNIFNYHFHNLSGDSSVYIVSDWFKSEVVTGYTIINRTSYSVIDNERIERVDDTNLYLYDNGSETIKLGYDISEGDIIPFMGISVKVDSIKQENIFDKSQDVIYVSNKISNSDTLITGKYTMIYGVLSYSERYNNSTHGYSLSGALVDGIEYGQIY